MSNDKNVLEMLANALLPYIQEKLTVVAETTDAAAALPTAKEIADEKKTSAKDVLRIAAALGIATKGLDADDLRAVLVTIAKINEGETKLAKDAVLAALEVLGIEPAKRIAENIESIKAFITTSDDDADEDSDEDDDSDDDADEDEEESEDDEDSDEDEEESDDEDEEESEDDDDSDEDEEESDDEDEEESEDDEEESDDEDSDEDSDDEDSDEDEEESEDDEDEAVTVEQRMEVAKKAKQPKQAAAAARLGLYNKALSKKEQKTLTLKFDPADAKSVKAAYTELLAKCVDDSLTLADWETPYVYDGMGYCCGLPLKETGEEDEGKCRVSGKTYKWTGDAFEAA